jgi:hypothetical protein
LTPFGQQISTITEKAKSVERPAWDAGVRLESLVELLKASPSV